MARGEEFIIRKKNKSIRKKLRSDSAKVSNRIAAIIAQKKRRQSGKRRMCQGMCFSLPTPEDPFNEKYMNLDSKKKDKKKNTKKEWSSKGVNNLTENGSNASENKRKADYDHRLNAKGQEHKRARVEKESTLSDIKSTKKGSVNASKDEGCPSKFLISCLKTIQDTMHNNEAFERGKPLFFDSWGFEFWRCHSSGRHVLDTSGGATMEQIAWIGSTAIDTITRKEKEGVSFTSPYLLFIVPSKEKATQVRAVCKPFKAFGIHTVSLHPGASIDHQIHGLKTCEPEFLVSTPDRLLELVSLEAVDISGVCSLIVDGLELDCPSGNAYLDSVRSIRQHISVDPHNVVFCSGLDNASLPAAALSSLLPNPMYRLSREESFVNKCQGIVQTVYVVTSPDERLQKGLQVLHEVLGNPGPSKLTLVVGKGDTNPEELVAEIRSKGYSISRNTLSSVPQVVNSENEPIVSVIDSEDIDEADLSEVEVIIIYKFDITMDEYKDILTRMARYTINGKLHVILTREDAPIAAPLADVLQQCGQQVPKALKQLTNFATSLS